MSAGALGAKCPYSASHHEGKCLLVKTIEYHENGTVKRVEFFSAADFSPLPAVQYLGVNPYLPYFQWPPHGAPYLLYNPSCEQNS